MLRTPSQALPEGRLHASMCSNHYVFEDWKTVCGMEETVVEDIQMQMLAEIVCGMEETVEDEIRMQKFAEMTDKDPEMRTLKEVICPGWPPSQYQAPSV